MQEPLRYGARLGRINIWLVIWSATALFLLLLATGMQTASAKEVKRLMLLGDSLTAGYGLQAEHGFAAQLQRTFNRKRMRVDVLNAGVSGDTSAGGLARLDWALADKPTHAVVELGANDGLRGLDPEEMKANLDAIVTRLRGEGVEVMIAGMLAPPNMGRAYGDRFNAVFAEVAQKHDVLLYPFFLDGVAASPALNQADGIHPNQRGVAIIVERIFPSIERLLSR